MSDKLRVLLAQLPVPSSPELNTPLAAGYLRAYAEARGLLALAEVAILPRALADAAGDGALVEAIVARAPDVLGLSLYTWNSERSLGLAARLKARMPGLIVLVGGPEVQPDNPWVLEHPGVDIAVVGEGEQSFAELLTALGGARRPGAPLALSAELRAELLRIPGLALRDGAGAPGLAPERVALSDLSALPSPYLGGHLELPPDGMQMVEISRWCPYSCSFCLYGRNMGPRLGGRYFGLEQVLAEVAWGKARGVRRVHFVEANLNLVPLFWPLMRALADLNADRQITFYAELRGEHLTDAVVAALAAANVRVVEVGLQTANPAALRAARRRTDLAKWAAGTRRLYARGIEVLLDVILGLPDDDAAGVAETLDFISREGLGSYDIFTLQLLPGTAVRREAAAYGLRHQGRPPYYVLGSDRLSFDELRRLRRELKLGAGLDPDAVEGAPEPRAGALAGGAGNGDGGLIRRLDLREGLPELDMVAGRLAAHLDLLAPADGLAALGPWLAGLIAAEPAALVDLYLLGDDGAPPAPAALRSWRAGLPHAPGYLDRVAVYAAEEVDGREHGRVSPRLFLALPWSVAAEPADYRGVAELIWRHQAEAGAPLPLGAWRVAGGAGIWLSPPPGATEGERAALLAEARAWAAEHGRLIWE